ncbi:MAG: PAS domain-containing protein, partial [Prochlorothrix sp.]
MQDLEHRLQDFMHHFPGCIYYKVPLQEGSIDRCDPQLSNEPSWSGKSWHDRFRFSFVSGGIATMTGYDPEDYTGGHVSYDLHIHLQEQDWVWGQLQAALDQQQPYQLEYRLKRRDSSWIRVWERGCGVF